MIKPCSFVSPYYFPRVCSRQRRQLHYWACTCHLSRRSQFPPLPGPVLTCVVVHLVESQAGGPGAVPVAPDAGAPVTADHGELPDVVTAECLRAPGGDVGMLLPGSSAGARRGRGDVVAGPFVGYEEFILGMADAEEHLDAIFFKLHI